MTEQSLARLAGMLCGNPKFQAHLGVDGNEEAAAVVRRSCGIKSRRELDRDPAAAQRFHELRRRFAYQGEA